MSKTDVKLLLKKAREAHQEGEDPHGASSAGEDPTTTEGSRPSGSPVQALKH